jgi:hypothetical protein
MEILREVERAMEELGKRRTEWRRHKAHLEEITRWTTDLLSDSEERLDRVLKRVKKNPVTDSTSHPIPVGIFREEEGEREKGWIQSILRVCEAKEGMIQIREMVDLLLPQHKLSADTIRGNVMAVLLDSAVTKKGIVKYVKGLVKRVEPCVIRQP